VAPAGRFQPGTGERRDAHDREAEGRADDERGPRRDRRAVHDRAHDRPHQYANRDLAAFHEVLEELAG
jgi:hypothetical protein